MTAADLIAEARRLGDPTPGDGLTDVQASAWDALLRQASAGIGESIPVPGDLIRAVADDADRMWQELGRLRGERNALRAAIAEHHAQKADDRCIEDDDRLYTAAGLPPCDRRVGDKAAMLANCARFIDRRCEGGGWPSYRELEAERDELLAGCRAFIAAMREHAETPAPEPFVRALVEAMGVVVTAVHKAEGRIDATER
jgi:class 3 adenylate cyclase